jgi:hypothetical protein
MVKLQYIFASRLCVPFSHFMFSAENFTADFVVLHFFIAVGKGLRNVFFKFALKYHSSPSKTFNFQNRVTYDTSTNYFVKKVSVLQRYFYAVHR